MKLPGYRRERIAQGVERHTREPAGRATHSTYETDQPWVVYHYGLTHDQWWPPWRSTRVLGRMKIICECMIYGDRTTLTLRIPRFGTISPPARGKHIERLRYLRAHVHPDRPSPMAWARPLLNMAAHPHGLGLDLDALAMRLEADLRDAEREAPER